MRMWHASLRTSKGCDPWYCWKANVATLVHFLEAVNLFNGLLVIVALPLFPQTLLIIF
jgi:hypothetical protein